MKRALQINCRRVFSSSSAPSPPVPSTSTFSTEIYEHIPKAKDGENYKYSVPLMEKYRPHWPEYKPLHKKAREVELPPRTVPESALRFEMTSLFDNSAAMQFYSHLPQNPANFKVALNVTIDDLNLSKEESDIFIALVGKRYKHGQRECRITCDRFMNRIENKKYATIILERLVAESKRIRECELMEQSDPEAFKKMVENTPKDDNLFDVDPDTEWRDVKAEEEERIRLIKRRLDAMSGI